MFDDLRIDEAFDQQKGIDVTLQPNDGPDAVLGAAAEDGDFATAGFIENLFRNAFGLERQAEFGARHDLSAAFDDQDFRQRPERRVMR